MKPWIGDELLWHYIKFRFILRSISIQNQFIIICKFMSLVINVILVKIHFTLRKNIKFKDQNFCAATF